MQNSFRTAKAGCCACGPVIPSRRLEGTYRIHLQSYESITNYNHGDEGCTCRRNVRKELPNDRAQQHRRPSFSTVTPHTPQQSLRVYLNSHSAYTSTVIPRIPQRSFRVYLNSHSAYTSTVIPRIPQQSLPMYLNSHSTYTSPHCFLLDNNIFIYDDVMFLIYCLVGARLIFCGKIKQFS